MRISVLIEPVSGKRYRARGSEPLGLIAEGATRDEALQNLRDQIEERVAGGAESVSIDLPEQRPAHAWLRSAGMIQDDPLVEEWKQAMVEYRRQVDLADSEQSKP